MGGVLVNNLMMSVTLFSYSIFSSARSAEQRNWYMRPGVLEPYVFDEELSLAFVANGRRIFVDEKRVGDGRVTIIDYLILLSYYEINTQKLRIT